MKLSVNANIFLAYLLYPSETPVMTKPTVHLNGTHRKDLYIQYSDAIAALRDAITALQNAAPNGRDYYPQGDLAIYRAQDEHAARLCKLGEVKKELEGLLEAVAK